MFFMHGSYRAPIQICTKYEGPIIGLKEGLVWIGVPVNCAGKKTDQLVSLKEVAMTSKGSFDFGTHQP